MSRERLEALVERLITLLDTMDGDPDLEDEPVEADSGEEDERYPTWAT